MEFQEDNPLTQVWRAANRNGGNCYDFGDGRGLVPARRHTNPNGALGGWVAESAFVAPEVCVEKDALVYGSANVMGNAWLLDGAVVRGNAQIKGAVIVGRAVVFENYAQCKIPPQVRHPVYIGYPPRNMPSLHIVGGKILEPDYSGLPKIRVSEHPILIHWREKGYLNRVIYTDDKIIYDRIRRGYEPIESYTNPLKSAFTPRAEELPSWSLLAHDVAVRSSENVKGRFPVLLDGGEIEWPDRPVKRIGRMPTTVDHPTRYMKH